MSDPNRAEIEDDPVRRRIARIFDAKRRDNEEVLGALRAVDSSWERLHKDVDQAIGKEFDLLGAEERAVKAARDRLDRSDEPEIVLPAARERPQKIARPPSVRDSIEESVRSVELRKTSMRAAHTAVNRFAELTREGLETLREELAAGPPEIRAAVPVAGIEVPEAEDGGGHRPRRPIRPATSTPLEHVRGIGPKRAAKLRAAGIPDLEAFLATEMATLVEVLGFDVGPTREEAERVLVEHKAKTGPRGGRRRGGGS